MIRIDIDRSRKTVFTDQITLSRMKRSLDELAGFLFLECAFPQGCFLMTGTGMVPPPDFTLRVGDHVRISIDGIGTLANIVGTRDT